MLKRILVSRFLCFPEMFFELLCQYKAPRVVWYCSLVVRFVSICCTSVSCRVYSLRLHILLQVLSIIRFPTFSAFVSIHVWSFLFVKLFFLDPIPVLIFWLRLRPQFHSFVNLVLWPFFWFHSWILRQLPHVCASIGYFHSSCPEFRMLLWHILACFSWLGSMPHHCLVFSHLAFLDILTFSFRSSISTSVFANFVVFRISLSSCLT